MDRRAAARRRPRGGSTGCSTTARPLLHERNQAAFEAVHGEEHDAKYDDRQEMFRKVLSDQRVSTRDRVRMAATFGTVTLGIFATGQAFGDIPSDGLSKILRGVVRDIMRERRQNHPMPHHYSAECDIHPR